MFVVGEGYIEGIFIMASYNRVIIMGNLTRDPELRQLSSGQSVCRLGLASNRQFKNRQTGMMVQEVCFVDIDVWGAQADSCSQYLQKGRGVLIEGRLKLDSWVDNDGQRRSKHSIVADRVTFLPSQATSDASFEFGEGQAQSPKQAQPAQVQTPAAAPKVEPEKPKAAVSATKAEQKAAEKSAPEKQSTGTGEVDFKDQQPFEDDLPF